MLSLCRAKVTCYFHDSVHEKNRIERRFDRASAACSTWYRWAFDHDIVRCARAFFSSSLFARFKSGFECCCSCALTDAHGHRTPHKPNTLHRQTNQFHFEPTRLRLCIMWVRILAKRLPAKNTREWNCIVDFQWNGKKTEKKQVEGISATPEFYSRL